MLEANRWQQLGSQYRDVNQFLDSIKLDNFRMVAEKRKRIAERIKELQPDASNRAIAQTLGVTHTTINRDSGTNVPEGDGERKQSNGAGQSSGTRVPLSGAEVARKIAAGGLDAARNHRAEGTGENEWFTPPEYIAAAREVMGGIDLDPATHPLAQKTIGARQFYTAADDGLAQPWHGRVWLNPPYAQPLIAQFIKKLVEEVGLQNVQQAILLTHNYTDTAWFHQAERWADRICFTRGRVKFVDADGSDCAPTQGQAFFYFGTETEQFSEIFGRFGFVR